MKMPRICCVLQCNNTFNKGSGLKCHVFPNDVKRKAKWIRAIKIGRKPSENMVVCGEHFNKEDYYLSEGGLWTLLKKDSVPHLKLPITTLDLLASSNAAVKRKSRQKPFSQRTGMEESHENLIEEMDMEIAIEIVAEDLLENKETEKETQIELVAEDLSEDMKTPIELVGEDFSEDMEILLIELLAKDLLDDMETATELVTENEVTPEVMKFVNVCTQTCNSSHTMSTQFPPRSSSPFINIATQTSEVKSKCRATQTYLKRIPFSSLTDYEIEYLTGLDRPRFEVLFEMMEKFNPISENQKYPKKEALLLTLYKIRHNLDFKMIEFIFEIRRQDISTIFTEVIEKLYDVLRRIDIWDTAFRDPECYRTIIDCTEMFVARVDDPTIHQLTFSFYKHRPTFKVLVGCDEKAAVNFISDVYVGSIADREITIKSGIADKLSRGEAILADRGFDVSDVFEDKGVLVNIPPFLRGKPQLSQYEVMKTRVIANRRILIENINARAKKNRILVDPMPKSLWSLANKIVYISYSLINLYKPLK